MMARAEQQMDKRSALLNAAAKLVHERGFNRTSIADIADEAGVPLGNVYYYFRTRDAIGEALVERLRNIYTTARLKWDAQGEPAFRIAAFIEETISSSEELAQSGCPIGSLCSELHKEGGPLATHAAQVFEELLKWLEAQFREMGQGSESRDHAFHLVSALQGASLLANTFHDTKGVKREAKRLQRWVHSL
jgi:AcrR family transcriptional regulator